MAGPKEVWERFFAACDLPARVQKTYAAKFTTERIQPYMLKDLTKNDLRDLNVTALGDQLAILHYIRNTEGNSPVFNQISSNSVSSSSQASSSSMPRTRIVKRGHTITVADDIPIRNQSRAIQKRSPPKAVQASRLRSEQMVLEDRRKRFETAQPSTSRVFVNRSFRRTQVQTSARPAFRPANPGNGHRRITYSESPQSSRRAVRYVSEPAPRTRVVYRSRR
ncbi:unnamed protein product [Bursaphelenchus okinawaensis]|uniref:SAM domain-containing protein n=1 Tax=Bursaphelenchus okinawaensis TaxID=465554 RepID=A0A811LGY7_9BILA|nr:unnamed protein product [Bursaphelenchus okinawaensis]CAG9123622.1 unnamed protein product [Bursaphelenchus okinawaensis]